MHDEVGASLSEIAILSEVARRHLDAENAGGATEDRLRRIADTSRNMLESLGQIVWALTPRNDTLPALVGTLREHAARTLDAHALAGHLRFPSAVPPHAVSAETRRAVFLILKEALHNVVRHAQARTVHVSLVLEPERLTLTVADDGRGFERHHGDGAPRMIGGNGLGNMERRAAEIGGHLRVDSSAAGTTVRLDAPLSSSARSSVDVTRARAQSA
jgi:signal transduction histidine kinase